MDWIQILIEWWIWNEWMMWLCINGLNHTLVDIALGLRRLNQNGKYFDFY